MKAKDKKFVDILEERENWKIKNYDTGKYHRNYYPDSPLQEDMVLDGPDDGFCEPVFARLKKI